MVRPRRVLGVGWLRSRIVMRLRLWCGKLGRRSYAAARGGRGGNSDAGPTRNAGLTADSVCFCRRVHMQSIRPRASKLGAVCVEAEREQQPCEWLHKCAGSARTVAVRSRRVSSYASRSVRSAMLLHHLCVGRGSSTREQEDPEVRGGVGIVNQSGSIVSFHSPRHPAAPIPRRSSEQDHNTSRKAREPSDRASSIPVCRNIIAMAKPTAIIT
jgi:hypothetical protein